MTQAARIDPPVATTPDDKLTFEEFLQWGSDEANAEWVNGEIVQRTSPSDRHQDLAGFWAALLRLFVEAFGLGIVRAEFLMKLPSRPAGRKPDVLFMATANLPRLKKKYLDGPADLVIEIISPESAGRDRGDKYYEYAQAGIREYWLLDPEHKHAEFYQLGEEGIYHSLLPDADGIYHSMAINGLWLNVDWLWQEPLPPLRDVLKQWNLL
jgi:Uma2 family endonuclease